MTETDLDPDTEASRDQTLSKNLASLREAVDFYQQFGDACHAAAAAATDETALPAAAGADWSRPIELLRVDELAPIADTFRQASLAAYQVAGAARRELAQLEKQINEHLGNNWWPIRSP